MDRSDGPNLRVPRKFVCPDSLCVLDVCLPWKLVAYEPFTDGAYLCVLKCVWDIYPPPFLWLACTVSAMYPAMSGSDFLSWWKSVLFPDYIYHGADGSKVTHTAHTPARAR